MHIRALEMPGSKENELNLIAGAEYAPAFILQIIGLR